MAVAHRTNANAHEMALAFADTVRREPAARALYYRQWGHVAEFWLVTDAVPIVATRRLNRAAWQLQRTFPTALIDFQILNPRNLGDTDPESLIPGDADYFTLH